MINWLKKFFTTTVPVAQGQIPAGWERVHFKIYRPGQVPFEIDASELRPIGTSHCSTCNKFIRDGVACDYDWSGNCTAGDFIFARDGVVPRSGKAVMQDAEDALKDLNKSLRG